jgi:hypothetical protein
MDSVRWNCEVPPGPVGERRWVVRGWIDVVRERRWAVRGWIYVRGGRNEMEEEKNRIMDGGEKGDKTYLVQ